jgi:hypothetical protein
MMVRYCTLKWCIQVCNLCQLIYMSQNFSSEPCMKRSSVGYNLNNYLDKDCTFLYLLIVLFLGV